MPKTKRVQVLMEPDEFARLEQVARKRGASMSDLMREAARAQFLSPLDRSVRARAAQRFLALADATLPEWEVLKGELESRRGENIYSSTCAYVE